MHVPDPFLALKALRSCHVGEVRRMWGGDLLRQLWRPREASQGSRQASIRGFLETDSLFVHVPKAAGISVLQALYGNIGLAHTPIAEYRRLFRAGFIDRAFVFTFVRNPWDRVYSAYTFLAAGGWPEYDAEYGETWLRDCRDFEQFVIEVLPLEGAREIVHFQPQRDLLLEPDGEFHAFDFIGRYETLARDFDFVRQRVNPAARLVHRNRTETRPHADYREAYTPEMIAVVAGLFGECAAELGYRFDHFDDRVPALAGRRGLFSGGAAD